MIGRAPAVPIEDVSLQIALTTATVEPPPVATLDGLPVTEVTVVDREDDGEAVIVCEPDIWAGVDVVAVDVTTVLFAERTPTVRIPRATVKSPAVRLEPQTPRRAKPDHLSMLRREATPPAAIAPDRLRAHLLALFKASRLSTPADLQLVGIFERVPGGVIASVAMDGDTVVIRATQGRRARPATLAVGRVRANEALVTAEV
jgi:hypothetical protein